MPHNRIDLINQLCSLTRDNQVKWKKDNPDNPNAYSFEAILIENQNRIEATFLIDRYNTKDVTRIYNCINFAILDKNSNLIDDFVRCEQTTLELLPEYNALKELYSYAIENYNYFNRTIELPNNIGFQNV